MPIAFCLGVRPVLFCELKGRGGKAENSLSSCTWKLRENKWEPRLLPFPDCCRSSKRHNFSLPETIAYLV